MKTPFTPPLQHLTQQRAHKAAAALTIMLAVCGNIKAQVPQTFTCNSIQVTNTLTSSGLINAQGIAASSTVSAAGDISTQQDLNVSGDINLTGKLFLAPGIGLKLTPPLNGNGPIIKLGDITGPEFGDDPPACAVSVTPGGWFTPGNNYGLYSYVSNGGTWSTLTMMMQNNAGVGNGYIDVAGTLNGNNDGGLFINHKCGRTTNINKNGGSVLIGDYVNMNKFVEVGPLNGATTGFGQPLVKVNINGGTAMEINAANDNIKTYSIFKAGTNYPYAVMGDGRVQILADAANKKMLSVGDINAGTNPERFVVFGDGKTQIRNNTATDKVLSVTDAAATPNQEAFAVYGNGNTHLGGGNVQIGFNNPAIQDAATALNINCPSTNGIKLYTTNFTTRMISVENNVYPGAPRFVVNSNGSTAIGGELPTSSIYMLTVNGKLGAREIKVSIQNPWPDYVFEKNYKLRPLEETEQYIAKHKHLPNIPAATELSGEELNLDLAEMQGKQMEKIEEIYLHLIELNKQVKELKKENEALKNKLNK